VSKRLGKYGKLDRLEKQYRAATDKRQAARVTGSEFTFRKADQLCRELLGQITEAKRLLGY
jgi:hypothetical protein